MRRTSPSRRHWNASASSARGSCAVCSASTPPGGTRRSTHCCATIGDGLTGQLLCEAQTRPVLAALRTTLSETNEQDWANSSETQTRSIEGVRDALWVLELMGTRP